MSFGFTIHSTSGAARAGETKTPHGSFKTPAFMTVATAGAVKGLAPDRIAASGAEIVLANAYHLALRPGIDVLAKMGGLHSFMGWSGPLLTDSGGYQVFSLASIREVTDEGVAFQSHIDGKKIFISPEEATRIQNVIGADIIMAFDECPSPVAPIEKVKEAVDRTLVWARRCRDYHKNNAQALFGIVQGGVYGDLRRECAEKLVEMDFAGYGIGGLGIGEGKEQLFEMTTASLECLPDDVPRYLMGLGKPDDIVAAVGLGVDMFDCVVPTRNARNAMLFTDSGALRMRNAQYSLDEKPIMEDCKCYTCRNFSRSYIRHLYVSGEMLAGVLGSIHNLHHYQQLVKRCREAITAGCFGEFAESYLSRYNAVSDGNESEKP